MDGGAAEETGPQAEETGVTLCPGQEAGGAQAPVGVAQGLAGQRIGPKLAL